MSRGGARTRCIVRTSLIVGGPGPRAVEARARRARPRRRRSTRTRSARRCRSATSPRRCSSLRRSRSTGPLNVAGADDVSRADLAELVTRAARCAARPRRPGRPLDCSLDSSRAQALLRTRLRGVARGLSLVRFPVRRTIFERPRDHGPDLPREPVAGAGPRGLSPGSRLGVGGPPKPPKERSSDDSTWRWIRVESPSAQSSTL